MKIIFLVYRINYYRFFWPLIIEGLKRGYEIECWCDHSQPKTGGKAYLFPRLSNLVTSGNSHKITEKIFKGNDDLRNKLSCDEEIEAVFSLHPINFLFREGFSVNFRFRWFTLMHTYDSFFELGSVQQEKSRFEHNEIFCVFSSFWKNIGRQFLDKFYGGKHWFLDDVSVQVTGNPEFDMFSGISKNEVRSKYNIPEGKGVLLYLPFPYANRSKKSSWEDAFCGIFINTYMSPAGMLLHNKRMPFIKNLVYKIHRFYRILCDGLARRYFFNRINETEVFKAVRQFCDKNNLYLIVKPRLKFPMPDFIKKNADLVVWDNESEHNPPVLKELLVVSNLAISFYSFSVLSAVFSNSFHLNLVVPDEFFDNNPKESFWNHEKAASFFDFPGVCESWTIEKVINELGTTPLDRFSINSLRRSEYLKQYNEYDDYCSSERIFDVLKKHSEKILKV